MSTPRQLAQTLESLAQKAAMHGVVVNLEYMESPLSTAEGVSLLHKLLAYYHNAASEVFKLHQ